MVSSEMERWKDSGGRRCGGDFLRVLRTVVSMEYGSPGIVES